MVDEKKTNEFNKVVDATGNFLKAIFPHTYDFVVMLKNKFSKKAEEQVNQ